MLLFLGRTVAFALAIFASLGLTSPSAVAGTQVINLSHPDNLKRTHALTCIDLKKVKNVYTPADLSGAISKCIKAGKFDAAVQLMSVFMAYSWFDQQRMKDRSATAALDVLWFNSIGEPTQRESEGLAAALERLSDKNGDFAKATCAATQKLGPPAYEPFYMIAHGLSAMRISGDDVEFLSREDMRALLIDVDQQALWNIALKEVNHCPS